ncbi:unnamed protein product [Dibothriocephalus latus]|uniref:Reverse transcriptase domain-containing protein n=1 Tax=Dibothriocephalus latus TaxID=60516 RepID=A0A3P7NTP4_DIBLA|nr:unnamed protein product [Dibothriocephalus latus]
MERLLHDGMMISETFAVTNGLKQGCVLAPTRFSLMVSATLIDAYRDESRGIPINYRTDGHILNILRMQASTRVSATTVHYLLSVDDCAVNNTTNTDMQRRMDPFALGCANFGLTINTEKVVGMHQVPPSADYKVSRINVKSAELKNVDNLAYLGNTPSCNIRIDAGLLDGSQKPATFLASFKPLHGIVKVSSYQRNGRGTRLLCSQHSCTKRRLEPSKPTKRRG